MMPDIERLHAISAPVLLLTGGRDLQDFKLMAQILEATVSGLIHDQDPACGHLRHLEEPHGCAQKILAFLA
jgi:2-succinyl-6-hydroxy-2,4-cyclohexadiene-1-carboxylate synthase